MCEYAWPINLILMYCKGGATVSLFMTGAIFLGAPSNKERDQEE